MSNEQRQELKLILDESVKAEHNESDPIEIGSWYWILDEFDDRGNKKDKPDWWFGCVVLIGSNFVEFHSPYGHKHRVHSAKLHTHTRKEANAEGYISQQVEKYKNDVRYWINEAREVAKRLGVRDYLQLGQDMQQTSNTALMTCSGVADTNAYKKALIKAKESELPDIFRKIKDSTEQLSIWMKSDAIHLKAISKSLESSIDLIENKIFTVTLYAGISEEVVHIQKGNPAAFDERLHVMQRRCYMDEESLLNYELGGMEFKHIDKFDQWLIRRDNFERIFPFPRCMVSFKCRRFTKARDSFYLSDYFINVELEKLDNKTFLYIRNGENLYRMNCDLDFGHLMYGEHQSFDFAEPMMAKINYKEEVESIITKRHYDELVATYDNQVSEYHANEKLRSAWLKENGKIRKTFIHEELEYHDTAENPCPYPQKYLPHDNPRDNYEQFDSNNLYFDEITKHVKEQIEQYNRIALIIQGIFDRSPMLHPHAPVKLWDAQSFNNSIKLVYDGTATVYSGDKPDFKAFVKKCNESIKVGSITIGQEYFWSKLQAEKENERVMNRGRRSEYWQPLKTFFPDGNPGPGKVAKVVAIRNGKAIFHWNKRRQRRKNRWDRYADLHSQTLPDKIAIPIEQLFNVSAYNPGDYKQFFHDPRTRAEYESWAPSLLMAEEIKAGNFNVEYGLMQKEIDKHEKEGFERDHARGYWVRKTETNEDYTVEHVSDDGSSGKITSSFSHNDEKDDEDEALEEQTETEEQSDEEE